MNISLNNQSVDLPCFYPKKAERTGGRSQRKRLWGTALHPHHLAWPGMAAQPENPVVRSC